MPPATLATMRATLIPALFLMSFFKDGDQWA
jgi:hypothetical protein